MGFRELVDEFYSQTKNLNIDKSIYIDVIKKDTFTEINLASFIEKYESFLDLFVRNMNKSLGLKGQLVDKKLIYKVQKSIKLIYSNYENFVNKYIMCEKCKLDYTYVKSPNIICSACGYVKCI